ncbi:MAG: ATP-binding protein [Deltaproteobacteria bacterium]|nr:ATP-binding protein [Deltaproteobacteria bacterium]
MARISPELEQILRDLNPWWTAPHPVRPSPPPYRRRHVPGIVAALARPRALIQVLRGPRQVGKTTALYQIAEDLLGRGSAPADILLVRFDLQPLREAGVMPLVRWHAEAIRRATGATTPVILLDEIHKLSAWDEQVKHLYDTFPVRLVITGSSSVLVARGQRESLAGRAATLDFPPFLFREVLEAWHQDAAGALPEPLGFERCFDATADLAAHVGAIHRQPAQRLHSFRRRLDRYYNRGGYPRLYSGEVDEDRWADYLVETVFERVLGVDIPDLFPIEQPTLLRHIYLEVARRTGSEVSQGTLADDCNAAGYRTTQPVVGRYLHYLADALLIREFRRYPLTRSRTARVPVKITLTDLGVRNAIFRGAPSLWESPPAVVGPLVETLVQAVLRGAGLEVHFFRDYREPGNRRSPIEEIDFVVEALDGQVIPVEVKFRARIDRGDVDAVYRFMDQHECPMGLVVTREAFRWDGEARILFVPLLEFLLAF